MGDYEHKGKENTHTHPEARTVMSKAVACKPRVLGSWKDCGKFEIHKNFYLLYRRQHFKNKAKISYTFSSCVTVMYQKRNTSN
jgi:hypothetical protein